MIAGQLEVVIAADVARISRDMAQVQGVIGGAMQNVQRAIAGVTSAFAALGVSLGAGALTAMGKSAIDAADHLNDLSKSTGLAVEQLSGLGIAAKQSGSDLDGVANAVNKLSVNIGQHSEKFRALGVTSKEPLEAFKQLADVFSTIQDPQLRAALGAEALGKNWAAAAPLLAEGGAKIGEMVERGARLAGVTKEMAEQSDAFNDKLVLLTGTHGTLNQVVAQLLPLMNRLADQLLAAKEEAAKLGGADFSFLLEAGKAIVVLFGNVGFVLKGVGTEIGGIAAQLAALAVGDFKRAGEIGRMMKDDAVAARGAFDKWEASIMALGKTTAATTKQLDTGDQVTRRMVSSAEAAARAFIETEKKAKAAKDTIKLAGDATEHWHQWLKMLADIAESTAKAIADGETAYRKHIQAIDDAIAAEQFANDTRGMTRAQIEGVTIARLEERLAIEQANGAMESDLAMLQREIDKRKQLRDVIGNGEVEEAQRRATSQALTDQARQWDQFADRVVRNIGDMEHALKDFLRELLMMVAKKWILQIGADITGNPLLSAAGQAGGSSLTGSLAGSAMSWFGGTSLGGSFMAGYQGASLAAGVAGPTTAGATGATGLGSYAGTLGATGWGMVLVAAVALYAYLKGKEGGPKTEGTFGQTSILSGASDQQMRQIGEAMGQGYADFLARVGGKGTASFAIGTSVDPQGTAPSFLDVIGTGAAGEFFRSEQRNIGRSPEDLTAAVALETKRALLAAWQQSDLPPAIAEILNSVSAVTGTAEDIDRVTAAALAFADAAAAAAAAAEVAAADWEQAQDLLDQLAGRNPGLRHLGDAVSAFEAANPWAAGLTPAELVAAFKTITEEDFKAYSAENRQLILAILGLADTLDDTAETVTEAAETIAQAIYLPEQGAQGLAGQFDQSVSGLLGAQPDLMSKLTLTGTLLQNQIQQWQTAQQGLSQYSAEWQTLQNAIDGFKARLHATSVDLARLTILEAQYGKTKGEQLFELEKWYKAQQELLAGNSVALDALKVIFDQKWKEILDGVTGQADGARDRLREWWNGLFLNQQLSPLTPRQRLAEAEAQYRSTLALAQGGDATAIGNLAGASQTYLEIARQVFASSAAYTAIFREVAEQTGLVAQISQADINAKLYNALPATSMASDDAVFSVRDELRNLQSQLASMTLKTRDEELAEKIDRLTTSTEAHEGALTR